MQYYTPYSPQAVPVQLVYLVTPQEFIDKIDAKALAIGLDGAAETIGSLVTAFNPKDAKKVHEEV